MKIAVLGVGYVGTVTASCLADAGHQVVGIDPDTTKVAALAAGASPVVEPELDAVVRRAVDSGRLQATQDVVEGLKGVDIAIVCVGTPSRSNGSVDLTHLEQAAREIGEHVARTDGYLAVIVRSTVPPGTVADVVHAAVAKTAGDGSERRFGVVMCPEFLREGSGVADFRNPPFSVIGSDDERATAVVRELFDPLPGRVIVTSLSTAESLKYACNAFHAVKISFANEMGRVLRSVGVDSREVMDIFVQDDRLNIAPAYLRPGFAFGGSCLPKDLRAVLSLARFNDVELPMLSGVISTNDQVVRSLAREVLATGARRIALLGLSFKAETDDLRESPYVDLAELLIGKGTNLTIFDPVVRPELLFGANRRFVEERLPHLKGLLADSAESALDGASVVIVGVSTPEVREAILDASPTHVFDLVGALGPSIESLPGYVGVSW
jgi:GDP-mannose 6-dehydrogenase